MTLHHVALECRPDDANAEVAFWEMLGFTEVKPPASLAARARWVQRGGTQVHLLFAGAPRVAGHVAVIAEDYDAVVARLRDAGHKAVARAEHWGAPRTQVHTPAGHLVEVVAFPPPS